MSLPEKTVQCQCGAEVVLTRGSKWCTACGKQVFYSAKDKRNALINRIYILVALASVFTILTYLFIEMIATPLL